MVGEPPPYEGPALPPNEGGPPPKEGALPPNEGGLPPTWLGPCWVDEEPKGPKARAVLAEVAASVLTRRLVTCMALGVDF